MNVGLGWLGVAVGLVGCIATYKMAAASGETAEAGEVRQKTRSAAVFVFLLTLVFWAISMQKRLPFSPGQGLGLGFLIGGITGAMAILLSCRLGLLNLAQGSERQTRLASLSPAFLSLFAASLTYSIFHGYPQPALIGFSIGAAMAGILSYYSLDSEDKGGIYAEGWAILSVTISAGIVLAVAHFNSSILRSWWPIPILLATVVLVASFIETELASLGGIRQRPKLSRAVSVLTCPLLVLILMYIYSASLLLDPALLAVVAVGILFAAIISWLAIRSSLAEDGSSSLDAASAAILLVVAFTVAAFKLWAGLGIALGLIAAYSIALRGFGSVNRAWRGILSLGLVILLFRLFVEQYRGDLGTADLRIHYTFIGAMLGALLPFMFASALARLRSGEPSDRRILVSVALMGLIAALSPILLYMVWDIKVVLGFVFGLSAAIAFMLLANLSTSGENVLFGRYSIALLAIGSQLTAIQFIGPLSEVGFTRAVRILILAAVVVISAVWVGFSARRAR